MSIERVFCKYCKQDLEEQDIELQAHEACRELMKADYNYYDNFLTKEQSQLLGLLEEEIKVIFLYLESIVHRKRSILEHTILAKMMSGGRNFKRFVHLPEGTGGMGSYFHSSEDGHVINLNINIDFGFAEFTKPPVITIPDTILKFIHLKKLGIYVKGTVDIPKSFKIYTELNMLTIWCDSYKSLPSDLKEIKYLTYINIDVRGDNPTVGRPELKSKLTLMPEDIDHIAKIPNLRQLIIHKLKYLPDSICNLISLEQLEIPGCWLPDNFGNLCNLKKLKMFWGYIRELPDSFGKLISLEELELRSCHLEKLTDSFGNLQSLKTLKIDNNYSKLVLPTSIEKLQNLESFALIEMDEGVTIPYSFSKLRIKELSFSELLKEFPPVIHRVPAIVARLKHLEDLYVDKRIKLPRHLSKKVKVHRHL